MTMSRRAFARLAAGTGALAALGHAPAMARSGDGYRATVAIFLVGGNDGWNMVVPTGERHAAYLAARGSVGIAAAALTPLTGTSLALHPAMSALRPIWDEGSLALVLNAGPSPSGDRTGEIAHHVESRGDERFVSRSGSLVSQLTHVAQRIAARGAAASQSFLVSHAGYDTHVGQTDGGANAGGVHAELLGELADALAGFHHAMRTLGVADRVTAYTVSDFGRSLRGNDHNGTDHGAANSHLVLGGGLAPGAILGSYPEPPADGAGHAAPSLAQEDYLAAITSWQANVRTIFHNPSIWRMNAAGLPGLFRV